LDDLPGNPTAARKTLYASPLGGYAESRIFDLGNGSTSYTIALGVGTHRPSGVVISEWSIFLPWDHFVNWEYDPRDVVPKQDHHVYGHLFDTRLLAVLNEGHLLARGYPVRGLLCGMALQSIPEGFASGQTVHLKLSLTSDAGSTLTFRLPLPVYRHRAQKAAPSKRRAPLFEKADLVEHESAPRLP
jgi:hypothetical protein